MNQNIPEENRKSSCKYTSHSTIATEEQFINSTKCKIFNLHPCKTNEGDAVTFVQYGVVIVTNVPDVME